MNDVSRSPVARSGKLVRRVAEAIGCSSFCIGPGCDYDDEHDRCIGRCKDLAICAANRALAAMREPTDEMVAAYENGVGRKTTREWWRAMLDAGIASASEPAEGGTK